LFFLSPNKQDVVDSSLREVSEYTIPLSNSISLRTSSDTRPHKWKIADLQKGLRFVYDGKETVGEGTGFGVPVLLYSGETCFSGSSCVYAFNKGSSTIIRKEFIVDRVHRKTIRSVKLESRKMRALWRLISKLYMRFGFLRTLMSTDISKKLGLRTDFIGTHPLGKVIVTYQVSKSKVNVKVDLALLERRELKGIFVLNEQGSTFFRKYSDSQGLTLIDEEIGSWRIPEARCASITDLRGGVGFRLWRNKNSALYLGREYSEGHMDWVGLDYEISPRSDNFEYQIEILGVD